MPASCRQDPLLLTAPDSFTALGLSLSARGSGDSHPTSRIERRHIGMSWFVLWQERIGTLPHGSHTRKEHMLTLAP
jgi:hypothetical protein